MNAESVVEAIDDLIEHIKDPDTTSVELATALRDEKNDLVAEVGNPPQPPEPKDEPAGDPIEPAAPNA